MLLLLLPHHAKARRIAKIKAKTIRHHHAEAEEDEVLSKWSTPLSDNVPRWHRLCFWVDWKASAADHPTHLVPARSWTKALLLMKTKLPRRCKPARGAVVEAHPAPHVAAPLRQHSVCVS